MGIVAPLILGAAAVAGCLFGWRRIWRSDDTVAWKIIYSVIVAVPWFGLFFYFFLDTPPRQVRRDFRKRLRNPATAPESAVLRQWNAQEHIFLAWCGVVFVVLAIVAYWINDWHPGNIYLGPLGAYTDVDQIFFSLLILAVLAWGGACRAWIYLKRELALEATGRRIRAEARG